jgi:DNA repair protein RecO (recombination protein O)
MKAKMPVYSAEGVVLRKVDYGEADRILTIFTRERGKLPAIAKAVRRAKSHMSGQLDVFSHGHMLLAEGKRMDVVTQFQRITRNGGLAADLARAAAAAVVVEVADKVLEERHPQPELFEMIVSAIGHLSDPEINPRMELSDFLMRVLVELGYAPALGECARCGKPLSSSDQNDGSSASDASSAASELGFSPLAGGVICADCNRAESPSPPISIRAVKILRVCAAGDRDIFFRLRLDEADLAALEGALEAQLEHHLDRQLKSIDFARKVRRPA